MKLFARIFTSLHGRLVKATGGFGGGSKDGSVLVLDHVGARSGKHYTTPLVFINHNGGYAVVASMAGAPTNPGWYHNLKAEPDVDVTVGKKTIAVRAREMPPAERSEAWSRFVLLGDRWAAYEDKTDRLMPIMALEPR
jgi:deazaflavin-dependent oxidoreductase (nitroreductase family)